MGITKLTSVLSLVVFIGLIGAISAKSVADVKPKDVEDDAGPYCVICEFVMKELEGIIGSNATEEEIKAGLDKVCSFLPTTVQETCREFVEGYTDEIIDLLLKYESPSQVCAQLSLCTTSKGKKADAVFPGPQCLLCKEILEKLEGMLLSNDTEKEILEDLEKICSVLPSAEKATCDTFVEDYGPTIIHLLLEEVAPEAVCALIQLCSTNKVHKVVATQPPKANDQYCVLCEFVMKQLESTLTENSTEAEIEKALETVCSLLPITVRSDCDEFIKDYLPTLFNLLVQEVKPEVICTLLKFCPGPSSTVAHHTTQLLAKLQPAKIVKEIEADETCVLCEFIMKEVDSFLSNNATEEEITVLVENICTVLPGTLRAQCDSFLETYGKVLITLIVQQLDPKTICTKLALCTNTPPKSFIPSLQSQGRVKANPQECAFCEFIIAQAKDLLSKNSTEEEIKKALDDVCSVIQKFKPDCLLFVNRYADAIIQLLLQEVDPTQICTLLEFCSATVEVSDDECDLCQILVKFADDFIRSNSTEEEIIKGLLDVCSILPSNIKDQCTEDVKVLGPYIVANIGNLLTPDLVCQKVLGLCHQGKLGVTLCSRGPATWCASMENAKLCNAVSHCQRHAWN